MKPVIIDEFEWPVGVKHRFEFYEINDGEIPDLPWQQVYAYCNLDGGIVLPVYREKSGKLQVGPNLIGGSSETGETAEETLRREVLEETNCEVVKWVPLGYQKVWDTPEKIVYQLRVYAELEKIGEFDSDVGSDTHVDNALVNIDEVNRHLKWGKLGDFLAEKVKNIMQS
jgi:8-oxo-dGTP pyrophosphatase MutT (NUDIX family)